VNKILKGESMKISVLPVSYFNDIISGKMSIGEWAREGVSLGLDAIDISIILLRSHENQYLRQFRQSIETEGITVCGASTYPDFTHPEAEKRQIEEQIFVENLRALAEVGTSIVRITAGQSHPGVTRKEGITWALEAIERVVPKAEALGLQLVFENHAKPGVWAYPDFDFPPDIFLEMASYLTKIAVKIQFDCANPIAYGVDPLPLLKEVIADTLVIHASDTLELGSLKPAVIGQGLVPYPQIIQFLQENKYENWITLEEASGQGKLGVKQGVEFIKGLWESTVRNYEGNNR
jgi:sugar phosphate isomerase/epimerase